MKICCEHCLITSIGQLFGPVNFSDMSLVITLQTMEGEIAISFLIFYFTILPGTCKEAKLIEQEVTIFTKLNDMNAEKIPAHAWPVVT